MAVYAQSLIDTSSTVPAIGQTAITDAAGGDGVAYLVHVGGFIFGLAAIKLFANRHRDRATGRANPVY